MKKAHLLSSLFVIIFTFVALSSSASDSFHKKISPKEAKALIVNQAGNKKFKILDVRTPGEYNRYHIKNSILIDYHSSDFLKSLKKLNKNFVYLVYCRTSNRSEKVLIIMKKSGFRYVYEMQGGIVKWIRQGYPVE